MNVELDRLELGALTVFLPTASVRTFWISHDFAALFGLEFNKDAAEKLQAALRAAASGKPKGRLSIDREADPVTVHASNAVVMVHVLEVVRELAPGAYAPSDLERIAKALRDHRTPKAVPWALGDFFAVPLRDGSFGFGQVIQSGWGRPVRFSRRAGPRGSSRSNRAVGRLRQARLPGRLPPGRRRAARDRRADSRMTLPQERRRLLR